MKDAHQAFLTQLRSRRDEFRNLSDLALESNNITEARLNLECVTKLDHDILALESMFGADDDEEIVIVPATEVDRKLS